ncbi:MAG: hypothetical protein UY52_C0004G0039 [Parcubacteria group bacterium GW2011_GWC2_49_9]|nr:MAG: hypothetical protein UY52_C0004G0039 [Parcubacteria group bacterium GW2011_GWC2_49_9]
MLSLEAARAMRIADPHFTQLTGAVSAKYRIPS